MEYNRAIIEAITLEKAIGNIKSNKDNSYKWYSVKNKKGALIEVGGRNKNKLEIKAYIPRFESGNYVVYQNGFICSEYSIDGEKLEFPSFEVEFKISLLKFLNNIDFRKWYPKIKSKTYIKEYGTHYYL